MNRIKLAMKRNVGRFWPRQKNNRKIILLYHSVGDTPWAIAQKKFYDQINWLDDHCKLLSLPELIDADPSPDLKVAITFDDGYENIYKTVSPFFLEKKIVGTVYINTGWISDHEDKRRRSQENLGHYPQEVFLIWNEVLNLHQAGWLIGSHGVNHEDFTRLHEKELEKELLGSKSAIENHLNSVCRHFSYTWGRFNELTKKFVARVGYDFAVTTMHFPISNQNDAYTLPRLNISPDYTFNDFKNLIQGKWDYLGILQKIKGRL